MFVCRTRDPAPRVLLFPVYSVSTAIRIHLFLNWILLDWDKVLNRDRGNQSDLCMGSQIFARTNLLEANQSLEQVRNDDTFQWDASNLLVCTALGCQVTSVSTE